MNNIRLLNQNDLDSYIELMKFGHHNYEWDRYYLENVGIDRPVSYTHLTLPTKA